MPAPEPGTTPSGQVRWHHSLRTRIALWAGAIIFLILLAATMATGWYVRRQILDHAQRETQAMTTDAAEHLETRLQTLTVAAHTLAALVSRSRLEPTQLGQAQAAVTASTPGVAGTLLVLEAGREGVADYARYVGADGRERDFVADGYDYRGKPWYRQTVAAQAGWWSDPHLNRTAGGVWMASYNVPLQAPLRGMASLDIRLDDLLEPVDGLVHLPSMRTTLVAPDGLVAVSSIPDIALRETWDGYIARNGRTDLASAARAVRRREASQSWHRDAQTGGDRFTAIEPIGDSGWVLLVGQDYARITGQLDRAMWLLVATSLLLALLGTLMVRRAGRQISRPVEELSATALDVVTGLRPLPPGQMRRKDEVGVLARTLDQARTAIARQLQEIEQMGAARQKLESELSIARDIQLAMLPRGRVIDYGGEHVEAQAVLEPAKAVGGDFYNFIERGDGELWFVIGDVSDKGVPAALFMARAMSMLEVAVQTSANPAQALAEGSRRLAQGNETCMFATVLCGRLDVRSGALWLASAGHDPPLLLAADGKVHAIDLQNGPPLGFEVSEDFPLWSGTLGPGDCLLAYTDGVTEALDLDNQPYGFERMRDILASPRLGATDACAQLLADMRSFVGQAPPSDDTTVLAISRTADLDKPMAQAHAVGAKGETSVHISVAHTSIDVLRMTDAVDALLAHHGASAEAIHDARLVVEEVACNAVEHAVSADAPLELQARVDAGRLWLEFRDRGAPFDPTLHAAPDLDADLDDRGIGGLGVHLVRQLAEHIDYQRAGDRNVLRITLRLDAAHDKERNAS